MRRHNARRQALKVLYEAELSGKSPRGILAELASEGGLEPFAVFLVEGVSERVGRIDEILGRYSLGWAPERMPPVDRIIARIGIFEIVFTDTPDPVAIDEAVELAKEFSTQEASRFINGVLASVSQDRSELSGGGQVLRASEIAGGLEGLPEHLAALSYDMCPPAYGRRSLVEVGRWILAAIGLGDWDQDVYELPPPPQLRRLVVLVIDGLGAIQLRNHRDTLPTIWDLPGTFATSTFPSTSATGLTSICTGRLPGKHGILGYRLLERERSFNVIRYEFDEDKADEKLAESGVGLTRKSPPLPPPKRYQPEKTIFEVASAARIGAFVVTRTEFEGTGFSDLILRGASWFGYEHSAQAPSKVRSLLEDRRRKLIYVYWDGLDKEGHRFGPGSAEWLKAAATADSLCERLLDALFPGDGLLVVSDHGMVSTPEESRIELGRDVRDLCRAVTGEPRVRYLHARPGAANDLFEAALGAYGGKAWVFTKEHAVSLGLYGEDPVEGLLSRAGDVVVAMRGDACLVDPDFFKPPAAGNHGSLTEEEIFVPFRAVVRG